MRPLSKRVPGYLRRSTTGELAARLAGVTAMSQATEPGKGVATISLACIRSNGVASGEYGLPPTAPGVPFPPSPHEPLQGSCWWCPSAHPDTQMSLDWMVCCTAGGWCGLSVCSPCSTPAMWLVRVAFPVFLSSTSPFLHGSFGSWLSHPQTDVSAWRRFDHGSLSVLVVWLPPLEQDLWGVPRTSLNISKLTRLLSA